MNNKQWQLYGNNSCHVLCDDIHNETVQFMCDINVFYFDEYMTTIWSRKCLNGFGVKPFVNISAKFCSVGI